MKHIKADEHQGNKAERDKGWLKKVRKYAEGSYMCMKSWPSCSNKNNMWNRITCGKIRATLMDRITERKKEEKI